MRLYSLTCLIPFLLESGEAYYRPSLKKLHEFLVKNGISVSFEDFERVYFEVRDKFYSESRNLEEPHFNVRVSDTLERLKLQTLCF